jgi:hypothetical protein
VHDTLRARLEEQGYQHLDLSDEDYANELRLQ